MLSRILGLAALLACLPAHAWAQGSVLRPIDRATVRVLAIEGARPTLESVGGTSYRVANNDVSLGSGLAIEPRVVVTAAHVIRGAHAWIVTAPDAPERAFAAHPIYVHPSLDLAFLAVDGDLPHHARLGRARQLRNAEAITISGYPLEMSEATPASASGQLARVREDGTLQLSIAVNPGHSGGPVADGRGRPIGIVTMRGDPERGAGGVGFAIGLAAVRDADAARRAVVPHVFTEVDRMITTMFENALRSGSTPASREQVAAFFRARIASDDPYPEADACLAAAAWNAAILLRVQHPADPLGPELLDAAQRLARRALAQAPHLRVSYSLMPVVATGQPVFAHPPPALQASR